MYKNNSRDSSKFKGCSPLRLPCYLTGKCHAFGYYSYTNRWAAAKKTTPNLAQASRLCDRDLIRLFNP